MSQFRSEGALEPGTSQSTPTAKTSLLESPRGSATPSGWVWCQGCHSHWASWAAHDHPGSGSCHDKRREELQSFGADSDYDGAEIEHTTWESDEYYGRIGPQ